MSINISYVPSLKNLSARMLGVSVQQGEHSSVQDAQAAMRLYTMFKKDWEKDSDRRKNKNIGRSKILDPSDVSKAHGSGEQRKQIDTNTCTIPPLNSDLKRKSQLQYEDSD